MVNGYVRFHKHPAFLYISPNAFQLLMMVFLWLGVHRLIAPPLVMLVAMLVQFTILRVIFTKWGKH
jgi:hypothetical protein